MATAAEQRAAIEGAIEDLELDLGNLLKNGPTEPVLRIRTLLGLSRAAHKKLEDALSALEEGKVTEEIWHARCQAASDEGWEAIQERAAWALDAILAKDKKLDRLLPDLHGLLERRRRAQKLKQRSDPEPEQPAPTPPPGICR